MAVSAPAGPIALLFVQMQSMQPDREGLPALRVPHLHGKAHPRLSPRGPQRRHQIEGAARACPQRQVLRGHAHHHVRPLRAGRYQRGRFGKVAIPQHDRARAQLVARHTLARMLVTQVHFLELLGDPRVILTPHAAFYSVEAERELRRKAAQNLVTWSRTGRPDYPDRNP